MLRHNKYRPYVRRARGDDRTLSIRLCIRMAYYWMLGKPYYVMVQRGFPKLVIACGESKEAVKKLPVPVFAGWMSFRQWAKAVQEQQVDVG